MNIQLQNAEIMKTQYLKTLACMLFLILEHMALSQSLIIDGRFVDDHDEKVAAKYTLMCNGQIIKVGVKKRLKMKLSLNQEYTLMVSKEGFKARSVKFSTNTKIDDNFIFLFDVILSNIDPQLDNETIHENTYVVVYYDAEMDEFSYRWVNKNQSLY